MSWGYDWTRKHPGVGDSSLVMGRIRLAPPRHVLSYPCKHPGRLDFPVFPPHSRRLWIKHPLGCGMPLQRPKSTPRRMSLSRFAWNTMKPLHHMRNQMLAGTRDFDLPAPVSFSWPLSPIARQCDRCYWNCLNLNEQLPHYAPTASSAATCAPLQRIWSTAGKKSNSAESTVCVGLD